MSSEDAGTLKWFVAYTRTSHEKRAAAMLQDAGYEAYVAVQQVVRQWSDRKKRIDVVVLPRLVFVRCTEADRNPRTFEVTRSITGYMTYPGTRTPVVVPDDEIRQFRYMLGHSDAQVKVRPASFESGDKVRVVRGPLAGFECELLQIQSHDYAAVSLGFLGTATIEVSLDDLEKI